MVKKRKIPKKYHPKDYALLFNDPLISEFAYFVEHSKLFFQLFPIVTLMFFKFLFTLELIAL